MRWLKQLITRRRRYDEISELIQEHIDEKVADLIERGMTREQAESTARCEFGNVTRIEERSREVWQWPRLEGTIRDIRYGVRRLCRSPGFTATAVLIFAFGIGSTTAIFSVVEGVLLRPLPFYEPQRLIAVSDVLEGTDVGHEEGVGVSALDIQAYPRDTHSFEHIGGYQQVSYELLGGGEPAQVHGSRFSSGVFPALGIQPLFGRTFTAEEETLKENVVVLSYFMWQKRLHGDPQVLGAKIYLDRVPYVVIGVMPPDFQFPILPGDVNTSELWVPMAFTQQELGTKVGWDFLMVGRLKPGRTLADAQRDVEKVARETAKNYPPSMAAFRIHAIVRPLKEQTIEQARPLVRMLFLAVLLVLLIACANLAGLLLVRAMGRRRDAAVRLALGASAASLVRQSVFESLALSVSGGFLGLMIAALALRVGVRFLPMTLPRTDEISLDWKVVMFALILGILAGVLCGLAPSFAAIRTNVNDALKSGGRTGTAGGVHERLRSILVVSQIAVAVVLLIASGLLLRSFQKMDAVDLGFRPDHTLVASYTLPRENYPTQAATDEFGEQLLRRIQDFPGIESVGTTSFLPASGASYNDPFVPEGNIAQTDAKMNLATSITVRGNYFSAMGIPLLRGRLFTPSDRSGSQLVVIINHALAESYWPHENPIGKRMRLGTAQMSLPWMTVVGEVADVKEGSPDGSYKPEFYQPVSQREESKGTFALPTDLLGNTGYIVLRTSLPPDQMENSLRTIVRSIDRRLPLAQVQTMEQVVSDSESARRFNTALISSFALAAILLAFLGIYSVIAFLVAMRSQEMAIRMALGCQRSGIRNLVLASGVLLRSLSEQGSRARWSCRREI